MQSLTADLTTPVTFERGSLRLTFDAFLEKVTVTDTGYKKLLDRGQDLVDTYQKIVAQMLEVQESVGAIKPTTEATRLEVMGRVDKAIRNVLEILDPTASIEPSQSYIIEQLQDASTSISEFGKLAVPSPAEVVARQKDAEKKLKGLQERLNKIRDDDMIRGAADRICYLVKPVARAVTGDAEPVEWNVTPESLMATFSGKSIAAMLELIEKKVGLASHQTAGDSMN